MAFSLTYGSSTLILPDPLLGDSRTYDFGTVVRSTRGGDLKVGRAPWPVIQTRAYNFDIWSDTDIDDLITFFTDHAGEQVLIQDNTDVGLARGLIITPDPEIIIPRDNCWYQIGFEFAGIAFREGILLQESLFALLQESGSYILL